jgi:hypothetical protein
MAMLLSQLKTPNPVPPPPPPPPPPPHLQPPSLPHAHAQTGFLLGTRQTLLETFDGGKTWEPRIVEAAQDEGFNYRFNSLSFNGDEGEWG